MTKSAEIQYQTVPLKIKKMRIINNKWRKMPTIAHSHAQNQQSMRMVWIAFYPAHQNRVLTYLAWEAGIITRILVLIFLVPEALLSLCTVNS
jgi:hypothetical protein